MQIRQSKPSLTVFYWLSQTKLIFFSSNHETWTFVLIFSFYETTIIRIYLIYLAINVTLAEKLTFAWNLCECVAEFVNLACSGCCKGLLPKVLVGLLARLIGSLCWNPSLINLLAGQHQDSNQDRNFIKCLENVFMKIYTSHFPLSFWWKKLLRCHNFMQITQ